MVWPGAIIAGRGGEMLWFVFCMQLPDLKYCHGAPINLIYISIIVSHGVAEWDEKKSARKKPWVVE
jgi:hypothetical protein